MWTTYGQLRPPTNSRRLPPARSYLNKKFYVSVNFFLEILLVSQILQYHLILVYPILYLVYTRTLSHGVCNSNWQSSKPLSSLH